MKKLKEMIERERHWKTLIEIGENSRCDDDDEYDKKVHQFHIRNLNDHCIHDAVENSELKSQIIEILQESGRCKYTHLINPCNQAMEKCSWCQGQEKINKLLEG